MRRYENKKKALGLCVVPRCENSPKATHTKCEQHLARWIEYHRVHKYGLTPEAYAALMAEQGNACAICRVTPRRLHIDHCHETGKVRGLLCGPCNQAMGGFRDSPEILAAALEYLQPRLLTLRS